MQADLATLLQAAFLAQGDERHRMLLTGRAMALQVAEAGAPLETALAVLGYRASNANTALHPLSTQIPLG